MSFFGNLSLSLDGNHLIGWNMNEFESVWILTVPCSTSTSHVTRTRRDISRHLAGNPQSNADLQDLPSSEIPLLIDGG